MTTMSVCHLNAPIGLNQESTTIKAHVDIPRAMTNCESNTEDMEIGTLRENRVPQMHNFRERTGETLGEEYNLSSPLIRSRWSAATLKVLSSMPSRNVGWSSDSKIPGVTVLNSQLDQCSRTQASVQDFSSSSVPKNDGCDSQSEDLPETENTWEQLVCNLQSLSSSDRVQRLRAVPLGLSRKIDLRKRLSCDTVGDSLFTSYIPCYGQLRTNIARVYRQCMFSCLSQLGSLQLWHVALKRVSGRFGTGVLSYFLFIRTLLVFNIFLFLTNGLFLVLPQATNPHNKTRQQRFTAMNLLTGTGYLSETVMFYGYYTNPDTMGCGHSGRASSERGDAAHRPVCDTVGSRQMMSYSIPLAYLFTIGITFFITGIVLVYSMSKSVEKSSHVFKSYQNWAVKVFCSWDFKVSKGMSVRHQSENIGNHLKELLSEGAYRGKRRGILQQLWHLVVHFLAWTICLASICLCSLVILYSSDHQHLKRNNVGESLVNEESLLVLPVLVSGINLLLPGLFNLLSSMEHYDSTTVQIYVAILRNLLLKMGVVGVLCYHWLGRMTAKPERHGIQCWESFVGQELYRFLLVDFFFTVFNTFCGEFLWRVFSKGLLQRNRKPVFDIARNVLELIYGQTLTWLGVLFSPLLPAVQIIKLLALFYMKQSSLMMNCQASRKPWRASQMTTLFISLLCFPSFLGAAVSVTYAVWTIKPSTSCGPFRNLTTMFQSSRLWGLELENTHPSLAWLSRAYTYLVENPLFMCLTAGLFLMVLYVYTQVVDGQKGIISLLREQIENEGMDKSFLIAKLQARHEQRHAVSSSQSQP